MRSIRLSEARVPALTGDPHSLQRRRHRAARPCWIGRSEPKLTRIGLQVTHCLNLAVHKATGAYRPSKGVLKRASAIDPVVLLYLGDDLRIGQFVRRLDSDNTVRQRLGAAETLLELQLGLTRPEDQKSLGLPQLSDDLVIVPVKLLPVAGCSWRPPTRL